MRQSNFYVLALAALIILIFILGARNAAFAADTTRAEFNETYQQLLANPSDIDLTLKYADLAVKLNDYEAAIPPLERLVMLNPNLHKTKLRLGTFYLKLGSTLVAKTYFEDVANAKDAPAETVKEAKQYLSQL